MTDSNTPTRIFPATDDAVKLFFPGQKISLKPLDDRPKASFTICKLSSPVTTSIVVLAKPNDVGNSEQVVIKIYDPRYIESRFPIKPWNESHPWTLATEQALAMDRAKGTGLSCQKLTLDWIPDDPSASTLFWDELFYRDSMKAYESEVTAYECLKHLQGSVIPRLLMTGLFLPLDERAIQLPALVLEYIPSISLYDVPLDAITPAICAPLLSIIDSFPSHGIIHNDITLTNIRFTPPEKPVKAILIDFGSAIIRPKDQDEEEWSQTGASDTDWARYLFEHLSRRRKQVKDECLNRFR